MPRVPARQLEHIVRISESDGGRIVETIRSDSLAKGVFQMVTCQRVIYAFTHASAETPGRLLDHFAFDKAERADGLVEPEVLVGAQAMRHLMEICSSLDALMPGERQVFSQFRRAVREARERGLVDDDPERIFDRVIHAARAVQKEVRLEGTKESLVPLTHELASRHLQGKDRPCVAVFGTGVIAKAFVAMVRRIRPDAHLVIVSHDRQRALHMAKNLDAKASLLHEFMQTPPPGLCLIGFAMRTQEPVVDAKTLQRWAVQGGPLLVLDYAMPRNAEPPAQGSTGVTVVSLDEMAKFAQTSRDEGSTELTRGREILDRHLQRYLDREQDRLEVERLRRLADRFEQIADQRWQDLPVDAVEPDQKQLHKWYEQTVRALRHEAIETVKDSRKGGAS